MHPLIEFSCNFYPRLGKTEEFAAFNSDLVAGDFAVDDFVVESCPIPYFLDSVVQRRKSRQDLGQLGDQIVGVLFRTLESCQTRDLTNRLFPRESVTKFGRIREVRRA